VAQYIRRTPHLAHIPVVLLTGAFEPVDQARAAEAGCDGVLAKPFEPQLVISRVKELLAKPRRVPSAIGAAPASASSTAVIESPPPLVDRAPPAGAAASTAGVPHGQLNDYFDRLDAAFATLSPQSSGTVTPARHADRPAGAAGRRFRDRLVRRPTGRPGARTDHWDLLTPPPAGPAADLPLSRDLAPHEPVESEAFTLEEPASHQSADVPSAAPIQHPARAEPVAPIAAVARPGAVLPPLADAFAALLAAEQNEPPPAAAPAWPATASPVFTVTDDLIEDITRRVLDRLSDRVVHDARRGGGVGPRRTSRPRRDRADQGFHQVVAEFLYTIP